MLISNKKRRMVLKCIFITQVRSRAEKAHARLLIDSIRAFGGPMRDCEIWVFATKPANEPCDDLEGLQVKVIPLSVQRKFMDYPFGDKVFTCATAEAMAASDTGSLIWLRRISLTERFPFFGVTEPLGSSTARIFRSVSGL